MFLFEVLSLTMQGRDRSFLVTPTISFIYSLSMFISRNMTKTIHVGMTIWWIEPSTSSVPMDLCFSSGPFVQHRLKQKSNRQGVCRVETISVFGDSTYSTSLVYVVRHTWIIFQILSIYVRAIVDYDTSSLTWCDMWYRTVDFVQSWLCWNPMRIKTNDVPCIIPYIFHNLTSVWFT